LSKADRLFVAGALKNAEKIYIEAIKEDPKDARPYRGLSKVYIRQNDELDAIASLEKACELDPTDDVSYNNLGFLHFKRKNYLRSIESYERSLAINQKKSHRYVNYALVLNEVRDYKKSANMLEKAVKLEPKKASLNMLIGVYQRLNDGRNIRKVYKKLLEINPKNKEAKRELAKKQ